jgi:uncharacterized protein
MRVAIVSDTHGVLDPRIREAITGADLAIHAGDIVGQNVLDELEEVTREVVAVRGNNDIPKKWRRGAKKLRELSEVAELELPGGRVVVLHGHRSTPAHRRHERFRKKYPGARAIIYGHSHRLVIDRDEEPWVLNPGAAGDDRTHGGPSCLILRATKKRWDVEALKFKNVKFKTPSRA